MSEKPQEQKELPTRIEPALVPYLQQVDQRLKNATKAVTMLRPQIQQAEQELAQAQAAAFSYLGHIFEQYGLDPTKDEVEPTGEIKRGVSAQ